MAGSGSRERMGVSKSICSRDHYSKDDRQGSHPERIATKHECKVWRKHGLTLVALPSAGMA
jgi:hypothetical protein